MFGILGFNADKARKIRDNKPWYIRYEQWRANKLHLELVLTHIKENIAKGRTYCWLWDFEREFFTTSFLSLFTGITSLYSDPLLVLKEIERRGFVVEKRNDCDYKISLPEVERLAPPVNAPEDIDKVREKYSVEVINKNE